jgi:PAS domain S-box-containing protein
MISEKIMNELIKLLLVEDDVIDQMAFKRAVKNQQLNYDFQIADSVKKATELLSKEEYDIVVTDYNLGDGTGFDIFTLAKDTPIIFTTGAGDEEIAVQALKSGAFDYLIKDQERIYLKALPDKIENATKQKKYEIERKKAQEALRKSEEQFRVLFENSPDAIFVGNEEGLIIDINTAACQLHGLSKEELRGKNLTELVPEYLRESTRLDYTDWLHGNITYRESASLRVDKTIVPVEIRANKIQFAGDNALLLLVRDITERKQAEKKIAQANRDLKTERDKLEYRLLFEDLLNNISTRFINLSAQELNHEITLALNKISQFTLADKSYIFLINDEKTKISRFYEWHRDEIQINLDNLQEIPTEFISWWMSKLNQHEYIQFTGNRQVPKQALKEAEIIGIKAVKSFILLPMNYTKKLIGFLGFETINQEKTWDLESIKLLQIVSEIIVNALQRKKTEETLNQLYLSLKNELDIASNVQRYLLPEWLIYEKNIMFSSTYTPSRKIGGDLFDIIPLSEKRYIVYIGDISGHGVQAALMMTAVKSIINMIIENEKENLQPYSILNRLNSILCRELFLESYMTILLCLIDLEQNSLRYYNAGHPSLIQYDTVSKKAFIREEKGSIPVGWSNLVNYTKAEENEIFFDENTIYVLYTDGIFECENDLKEQLGMKGLQQQLEKQDVVNCLMLPHKFKQSLLDANYDISSDDFTLLAFRKHPSKELNKLQRMFRIRSQIKNTGPIGKECEEFIASHLHNQELAAKVELLVNEFLNNIIEHGLNNKKDTIVILEIAIEDFIRITFWDKGLDWKLPGKEETNHIEAEKGKYRGLGFHIINLIATNVSMKRYDEINESVILIKKP